MGLILQCGPYPTPLNVAYDGLAAFVMSVNPALGPDEILDLMKASTVDLGTEGWDQYYGWGRLDFGQLALAAFATLPVSRITAANQNFFTVHAYDTPGAEYQFFRSSTLSPPNWQLVPDFSVETNGPSLLFRDLSSPAAASYYQLKIKLP